MDDIHRSPVTIADRTIVLVALILPTFITWIYFIWLNDAPQSVQQITFAVVKTIQFALPVFWVLLIQRQWPTFQLPSAWSLMTGILFGLTVGAAMIALYFALKPTGILDSPAAAIRAKVASFGIGSPLGYLLFAVFVSAIHSLLEEYYWRWFVFGQLKGGRWSPSAKPTAHASLTSQSQLPLTAILISSLGFAAHHVLVLSLYFGWTSPLTWLFSLAIAIGGSCWAWLYHKSNSLVASWLSHALVDAAIFVIGYQLISRSL